MSELLALDTSHKTAPLVLREKLALLDGGAETLIRELTGHPSIAEAVAISTCNRTELYLVVSDPVEAESHVLGLLARRAAIRPTGRSSAAAPPVVAAASATRATSPAGSGRAPRSSPRKRWPYSSQRISSSIASRLLLSVPIASLPPAACA